MLAQLFLIYGSGPEYTDPAQCRIYYEANEAAASGPPPNRGPHQLDQNILICKYNNMSARFSVTECSNASVALPMALYKYVYDYDYDYENTPTAV